MALVNCSLSDKTHNKINDGHQSEVALIQPRNSTARNRSEANPTPNKMIATSFYQCLCRACSHKAALVLLSLTDTPGCNW